MRKSLMEKYTLMETVFLMWGKIIRSLIKENLHGKLTAEGNLLMPGFKNAHTHSAMTFLRSYA